jgi:hypothetical protein
MSGGRSKWLIWLGVLLISAAIIWALWVHLLPRDSRNDEATYGQFILAIIGFLTSSLAALKNKSDQPSLDVVADNLAIAVHTQWKNAATERKLLVPAPIPLHWKVSELPVSGGIDAVFPDSKTSQPIAPLPELKPVTRKTVRSGGRRELFLLYGGLPTGRIVLLGEPGAGKTSAGIMLVLDALEHRLQLPSEKKAQTPIPILLTLSSWEPVSQSLERWVIAKLRETYPFLQSRNTVRTLIRNGAISLILDGLDEVPAEARVDILQALSEQGLGRIVILTRKEEMTSAARTRYLAGSLAIELEPVSNADAAAYLSRALNRPPPKNWDALLRNLRSHPNGAIAKALSKPLTVGLVRDSFEPADDVSKVLSAKAKNAKEVEDQLLDNFTVIAYSSQFDSEGVGDRQSIADRSLRYIAANMRRRGTRDLGWWQLPLMSPIIWRVIMISLCAIPFSGLDWEWTPGFVWSFSPRLALLGGLSFGLFATSVSQLRLSGIQSRRVSVALGVMGLPLFGYYFWDPNSNRMLVLIAGLSIVFGSGRPARLSRVRRRGTTHPWGISALLWGISVLLFVFAATWIVESVLSLALGFYFGLALLLVAVMIPRITQRTDGRVLGPVDSWRADALHGLFTGFTLGGLVGLAVLLNWNPFAPADSSGPSGLVGGSVAFAYYALAGIVFSLLSHSSGQIWIAALWLRIRTATPLRIIRFLEDAHRRGILRTVGTLYQFRHASLQDRLAESPQTGHQISMDDLATGPLSSASH